MLPGHLRLRHVAVPRRASSSSATGTLTTSIKGGRYRMEVSGVGAGYTAWSVRRGQRRRRHLGGQRHPGRAAAASCGLYAGDGATQVTVDPRPRRGHRELGWFNQVRQHPHEPFTGAGRRQRRPRPWSTTAACSRCCSAAAGSRRSPTRCWTHPPASGWPPTATPPAATRRHHADDGACDRRPRRTRWPWRRWPRCWSPPSCTCRGGRRRPSPSRRPSSCSPPGWSTGTQLEDTVRELLPVVVFLVTILVVSDVCARAGLFAAAARLVGRRQPRPAGPAAARRLPAGRRW